MTNKDNLQINAAPPATAAAATTTTTTADALKGWTMAALTVAFVFLYAAALIGWLKPLTDASAAARLEPMIFVIIGYYFGRLPAQQNEKTLKEEITRQTQKADAARHIKERVEQERETLEERLKNAKLSLASRQSADTADERIEDDFLAAEETVKNLRRAVATAIRILNS